MFAEKIDRHLDMLTREMYETSKTMSGLATELECNFFKSKYIEILRYLCHDGL